MKEVGVALIGTGFMARTHLEVYQGLERADVRYVVGTSADKANELAKKVGASGAALLEEVLADPEVDVVDLTVPTPLHAEIAVQAFEAGKHVIVEKPIALDLESADRMIEASIAHERLLLVAHVVRYWPEYAEIGRLLSEGQLGKPMHAHAYRFSSPPSWATWLNDSEKTGGVAVDLGIHDLDILNQYFGGPRTVHAWNQARSNDGKRGYRARLEYPGLAVTVEASMEMPSGYPFTAGLEVWCEKGVLEYRFRAGGSSFEQGEPENRLLLFSEDAAPEQLEVKQRAPFEKELEDFLECVAKNQPSARVTTADARLALMTALSINDSLDQGRSISLERGRLPR